MYPKINRYANMELKDHELGVYDSLLLSWDRVAWIAPKSVVMRGWMHSEWNVKWSESHSVLSNSLQPHELDSPWNSPGQNQLEGVAFLFSRGSSQSWDWTKVSRIAGRFFTSWATRETQEHWSR